jgi:RTX calcium-binding nonapeptide repeat (4 copies)
MMIRKTVLLLVAMASTVLLISGIALAANISCPNGGHKNGYFSCHGTSASDSIKGTGKSDRIRAGAGEDTVRGLGAVDDIYGDGGRDLIYGGNGEDGLWGGGGGSPNYNDASDDVVHGGDGHDNIYAGRANGGVDRVYGEGGSDWINAAQRANGQVKVTREIINCGAGNSDYVAYDQGLDTIKNCEQRDPY